MFREYPTAIFSVILLTERVMAVKTELPPKAAKVAIFEII